MGPVSKSAFIMPLMAGLVLTFGAIIWSTANNQADIRSHAESYGCTAGDIRQCANGKLQSCLDNGTWDDSCIADCIGPGKTEPCDPPTRKIEGKLYSNVKVCIQQRYGSDLGIWSDCTGQLITPTPKPPKQR